MDASGAVAPSGAGFALGGVPVALRIARTAWHRSPQGVGPDLAGARKVASDAAPELFHMPGDEVIVAAKRALRGAAKTQRAQIPAVVRQEGAARIAATGLGFTGISPPAAASAFLVIGEEINPAPLMTRLDRDGWQIALPVMLGKGQPLMFRAWSPGAPLRTVVWGIREPDDTAPEVEPDVVLVPLLAFDRTGHRLGYGGGFYDRSLRRLRSRKSIVAVGLAFPDQEVDAVPHLDYDERLDWVLTPEGPIRCHAH